MPSSVDFSLTPNKLCPNTDLGSWCIDPNLKGLSDLGLKENIFSVLDLLSSVFENNELWIIFFDSDDPEVENGLAAENEPNVVGLDVTAEEKPNKFVDLVSSVLVESIEFPKIGLDPKRGVVLDVFSNILTEDLSPNRKDVGLLKDWEMLFVDETWESFATETLTGFSSFSITRSIS